MNLSSDGVETLETKVFVSKGLHSYEARLLANIGGFMPEENMSDNSRTFTFTTSIIQ